MKSSTLMAIILVAQAVQIMGVFAAVTIENSAAVGEKEDAMEPINPGKLTCCHDCSHTSGDFKCQDKFVHLDDCRLANCFNCTKMGNVKISFKCNDVFPNGTCGPDKCEKK